MLRKILITLLLIVSCTFLYLNVSTPLESLRAPINKALIKTSFQKIEFKKIVFRPFNRISLQDVVLDEEISLKELTLYINPLLLVKNHKNPRVSIDRVEISAGRIIAGEKVMALFEKDSLKSANSSNKVTVMLSNLSLKYDGQYLSNLHGKIVIDKVISAKLKWKNNDKKFNISGTAAFNNNRIVPKARVEIKDGSLDVSADITGSISSKEKWALKAWIYRCSFGSVNFNDSVVKLKQEGKRLEAKLINRSGKIKAFKEGEAIAGIIGEMKLGVLSPAASGLTYFDIERKEKDIKGFISATNAVFEKSLIGDTTLIIRTDKTGLVNAKGAIKKLDYEINLDQKTKDSYEIRIKSKAKESAYLKYSGLESKLEFKISGLLLEKLPAISSYYPGLRGKLNCAGSIAKKGSRAAFNIDKLNFSGGEPVSLRAELLSFKNDWFCKAVSEDNALKVSGRLIGGIWNLNADLSGFPLKNIFLAARVPTELTGKAYGKISYKSDTSGFARLRLKDVFYPGYFQGSANIYADLNPESIDVGYFAVFGKKGVVTGSVSLGLNPYWGTSNANITVRKFIFNDKTFNGKLALKGNLFKSDKMHFTGNIAGSAIKVNALAADNMQVLFDITPDSVEIKSFYAGEIVSGKIVLDSIKGIIYGTVSFVNFPLNAVYKDMSGLLTGSMSLRGSVKKPEIIFDYSVPDFKYKKYAFGLSSLMKFKDNSVSSERIFVSSGTSTLSLQGKIWPEISVKGKMDYLSTELIGGFLGVKLPVKGGFGGDLRFAGTFDDPRVSMNLKGAGLFYESVGIPKFDAMIDYSNQEIRIEKLDVKFLDSEVIMPADNIISLKENKFKLKAQLKNLRFGMGEIFGGVKLNGELYRENSAPGVKGVLEADDLWINQYNLRKTLIGFDYVKKHLIFQNYKRNISQIHGKIAFDDMPRVSFEALKIGDKDRFLMVDGVLGGKKWNFNIETKNLPGEVFSEAVSLPLTIQGLINSRVDWKSSLEKPVISGNISISSGTISEMPFQTFMLNFLVKEDILRVHDSSINMKDKTKIELQGHCPFFLTKSAKKRVINNRINFLVSMKKGNLATFNGLLEDFTFLKGETELKLIITGLLSKPTWNGVFKLSKGEIDSKRYFRNISGMNINIEFKNSILKFKEFSGKIGDGIMRLMGSVVFDGFNPKKFDLTWKTEKDKGISITIPELPIPTPLVKSSDWALFSNLSHGKPKFNLKFAGPAERTVLSGWVELEDTHFSYPSVLKAEERESMLDGIWSHMFLNIELRAGKNTWYDNELASMNVAGGIKLTGRADVPRVNGKIEAQKGQISYFGATFDLVFANLEVVKDEVFLESQATTEVYVSDSTEPDTITMDIPKAEISKIKPKFSSKNNAGLSSEKALARATKMEPEFYEGADKDFLMTRQLIRIFDSSLTTPLANTILKKSGLIDTFKVGYVDKTPVKPVNPNQPTMVELLTGTKYSMEKYLTNQVAFGYALIFDRLQDKLAFRHELDLSYKWTKNLFITGSYQLDNPQLTTEAEKKISIAHVIRFGGSQEKRKTSIRRKQKEPEYRKWTKKEETK